MKGILIYIFVLNIIAYVAFAWDKKKAQRHRWRIPEARLLTLAFIGGGVGAWRGMVDHRHKTNKRKFRILVPLSIGLQLVVFIYICTAYYPHNLDLWLLIFQALCIHTVLFYVVHWFAKKGRTHIYHDA